MEKLDGQLYAFQKRLKAFNMMMDRVNNQLGKYPEIIRS